MQVLIIKMLSASIKKPLLRSDIYFLLQFLIKLDKDMNKHKQEIYTKLKTTILLLR